MATPPEVTLRNISGKYHSNKALSDDPDNFYKLQGIGWMTRKAISVAPVTMKLEQFTKDIDGQPTTCINLETIAAGLASNMENLTLDRTPQDRKVIFFGNIRSRIRFLSAPHLKGSGNKQGSIKEIYTPDIQCSEDDRRFLLGEILKDGSENPGLLTVTGLGSDDGDDNADGEAQAEEKTIVQGSAENLDEGNGWTCEQTWLFENVAGERRWTRRMVCVDKNGKVERIRMVFDYLGPA